MSLDKEAQLILEGSGEILADDIALYSATAGLCVDAPLPSHMDPRRYSCFFTASDDGLALTYLGDGAAAVVPADRAIPSGCGIFYFEAVLMEAPDTCCHAPISIGVATHPLADTGPRGMLELERSPLAQNELRMVNGVLRIVPVIPAVPGRQRANSGHAGWFRGSVGYTPHTGEVVAGGLLTPLSNTADHTDETLPLTRVALSSIGCEDSKPLLDTKDPASTPVAYASALAARNSAFAAFGVLQLRAPHVLDGNERLDHALRSALADEVSGARHAGWAAALRIAAGFCADANKSRAVHAWLLDRVYFCERRALPECAWDGPDEDTTMVLSRGHVRARDLAAFIGVHGDRAEYATTPLERALQHVLCILSEMRSAGMDAPMFTGRVVSVCLCLVL